MSPALANKFREMKAETNLTVMPAPEMSISKLIEIHIPRTHDQGDALAAAVAICNAAHDAHCREKSPIFTYGVMIANITRYLAAQHIAWMKGEGQ